MVRLLPLIYFALSLERATAVAQCTLRQPVNSKKCGKEGRPTARTQLRFSEIQLQTTDSAEKCALLCARREQTKLQKSGRDEGPYYCESFTYDINRNFCQLFFSTDLLGPAVQAEKNTGIFFYKRECFDCGQVCNQPVGKPLIDNGNFERALLGPWVSREGTVSQDGHDSRKSYECVGDTFRDKHTGIKYRNYYSCYLSQTFNSCAGETYLVEFDYKPATTEKEAKRSLTLDLGSPYPNSNEGSSLFVNQTRPFVTTWKTARALVTDAKAFLYSPVSSVTFRYGQYHDESQNGTYLIDNVRVSRFSNDTRPSAPELLVNGDFESGKLEPWHIVNNCGEPAVTNVTKPGLSSSDFALRLLPHPCENVRQEVQTVPGAAYLLNFEIKRPAITVRHITLDWGDETSGYLLRRELNMQNKGISVYSEGFVAQSSTMYLSISANYDNDDAALLLDNFSLKELNMRVF